MIPKTSPTKCGVQTGMNDSIPMLERMTNRTKNITLGEWLYYRRAELDAFAAWYAKQHEAEPDKYPAAMWPGEWDEQLFLHD